MSFFRSDNPVEDAQAYFAEEKELEVRRMCVYDGEIYLESEMIFEEIHNDWIALINVDEWLKLCEEFDEPYIYEAKLKTLKSK